MPFNIIRNDRIKKRGGGSALIIPSHYHFTVLKLPPIKNVEAVGVDLFLPSCTLRLITVYIPPIPHSSHASTENFIDLSDMLLSQINDSTHKTLICGDFNLPDIKWSSLTCSSAKSSVFLDFLKSASLTNAVTFPTRNDKILDLVLLSDPQLLVSCNSSDKKFTSDHKSIELSINASFPPPLPPKKRLDFFNTDFIAMNNFFATFYWEKLFKSSSNVNSVYLLFLEVIHFAITQFVPLIESDHKPYFPKHISSLFTHRDFLLKKPFNAFRQIKLQKVNSSIKRECDKFLRYKEKKLSTKGPKAIFNYIAKSIKPSLIFPSLRNTANELVFKDCDKAQLFAEHFSSVFSPSAPSSPSPTNFPFSSYSAVTVSDILESLPNKVNTSPDGLPYIILKHCAVSLAKPITRLLNLSLSSGFIPDFWKTSIILPLFKKGDKHAFDNYRPIALTSSLCKITEKLVYDHLLAFFNSRNILPDSQHGFRQNKSVTTQLLETFEIITSELDKDIPIDLIFFDFSKAFDCIPHDKLLAKLKLAGVPDWIYAWISSFLLHRNFTVKINDSFSSSFPAPSGVPQGSVIGPLLFIFYVSDLPSFCSTPGVFLRLFADDLKAFSKDPLALQAFIDKLHAWCLLNGLSISLQKCSVMHFLPKLNIKTTYFYNGQPFPICTSAVRDLGVMVDSDLTWKAHIKSVTSKAYKKRFLLFKSLKSTNPSFLTKMYCCYVRPILEFASPVFNPTQKGLIAKLEQVQRSTTRLIFLRSPLLRSQVNISYPERLKILNLTSLEERLRNLDLSTFHAILTNTIQANLNLSTRISNTRGPPNKLVVPLANRSLRKNFFTIRVATEY